MNENDNSNNKPPTSNGGDKPAAPVPTPPTPTTPPQSAAQPAPVAQTTRVSEENLEAQFKKNQDEVFGEGDPTRELRVLAFNNGYRLKTVDGGWVATKRS